MSTRNHQDLDNPFGEAPVEELAPEAPRERMASDKQEAFIKKLMGERDWSGLPDNIRQIVVKDQHTFAEARNVIDLLIPAPIIDRDPPEGIHFLNNTVYKVQVAHQGSGRKYAKRLIVSRDDDEKDQWAYQGRSEAFHSLSESTLMTLEQAKEFGRLYGMCCVCGATLTDETSIERGIGPVCEGRFR